MNASTPTFYINIDFTNPGHFFACGGLLEVAHRIWPGTEGWFTEDSRFALKPFSLKPDKDPGQTFIECLKRMRLSALTEEERKERESLEKEIRERKKKERSLSASEEAHRKEERLKELGELARDGPLHIKMTDNLGYAFRMRLDWWRGKEKLLKNWAGKQEIHQVARAAQDALSGIKSLASMFEYAHVLEMPEEYRKASREGQKSVEPFYFDARRFAHALDTGFSLDAIGAKTVAHPAVELLALIGLQRFRPKTIPIKKPRIKAHVEYFTWHLPLGVTVAAAAACGAAYVPGCRPFQFKILARDDQKRYGAFGWAAQVEGGPL